MSSINWLEIVGWGESQLEQLRMIGYAMLQQGHYKKAAVYFEGLTFLNPNNAYDQATLGALYLQMGMDEEAIKILDLAIKLDPSDELSKLNKVKAMFMTGQEKEALKIAKTLQTSREPRVAGDATALVLGHS